MLIQGAASAMRQRLDLWLAERGLRPRLIGEFDDAALLQAFGGQGAACSWRRPPWRPRPATSTASR